jgi:cytochrome c553
MLPMSLTRHFVFVLLAAAFFFSSFAADDRNLPAAAIREYCADCHDSEMKKGSLDLESLLADAPAQHAAIWEKAVRKMQARQMPPIGKKRPDEVSYNTTIAQLTKFLDADAAKHLNPGRTETFRRLNRTEYQNAVRDLLGVEIDATALLPKDDAGHGFDNVTVGNLSPSLLDRYISAAEKISHLAVGTRSEHVGGDTFRIKPDVTQEEHVEGLPIGTRGGGIFPYTFAQEGEYEIQIRLMRDRNEEVEGLKEKHQLELLLDRAPLKSFTVEPLKGPKAQEMADAHLKARVQVPAGRHDLGVTFVKLPSSLLETKRQPYEAHFNVHRHPRITPAIYQVSITGPYDAAGPGDTESRRKIFIAKATTAADEEACAEKILSSLMRRAYRRPLTKDDLEKPMTFFRQAREQRGFDGGVEMAISAILVNPNFLFRVEKDPQGLAPNTPYKISDIDLASRLSFFLWSSIPDDELLDAAIRSDLSKPRSLEKQVRRMLADPRAKSLVNNFADQWLYLRNLDSFTPDLRLFPDFDDNLRQAFRRETELFVSNIFQNDRSVLELLRADYTYLNERLAKHYGIAHLYGNRFRRVALAKEDRRGGLLRQGSILSVTSYATRTSPVIRGHWILGNLLGTPPPPPPPNTPALKENTISANLPIRQRLAEHRAAAACASCHNLMDPVGFSLENYDAIGRWRDMEDGTPVDVSGGFPDGSQFSGVDGLEQAFLRRPDLFVGALTEKLLIFALGRGIETYDAPAVRKIVRQAQDSDFRFSAVILGIVNSVPFKMRTSL